MDTVNFTHVFFFVVMFIAGFFVGKAKGFQ